ncbi:MAG: 30S ribosomal protein S2 [bacterium]|jgi:small subunit ribosomal protein S2|nr:30S ribosomal protein S2 [bacterium]
MSRVTVQQLLLAGSHFGHLTRRWNPKMRPYIFMEKNGIHIMDLKKTATLLEDAANRIGKIVSDGGDVLFVGTKDQAQDVMKDEATRCGMHYVSERWLGGMLTNFRTIRNSIRTLESMEEKQTDGTYERISKKEILQIERQKEKLEKTLGGIRTMKRLPGAVFVVDTVREAIAVSEARKLKIPVFAICDTNSDPDVIDYVIPANDDAFKSIAVITKCLADAVDEARSLRKEGFGQEGEQHAPERGDAKTAPRRRKKRPDGPARPEGERHGAAPAAQAREAVTPPAVEAAAPAEPAVATEAPDAAGIE